MIFCESTAGSAAGPAPSTDASEGAVGGATNVGASIDARMREMGGSTVLFFFTSPSSDFFFGFFSSMSETLSTSRRGVGEDFGATFAAGGSGTCAFVAAAGCGFAAGLCAGSVFFTTFAFAAAGFVLCAPDPLAGLCAAGLRAVLLVVLAGIFKIVHGSCLLSRAGFGRVLFSVHGVVNLLRFGFLHAQDLDKIFYIGIAQSFQIRKTRFDQGHGLLLGDRQCAGECLCGLRDFL